MSAFTPTELAGQLGSGLLSFPVTHFTPTLAFDEPAYRAHVTRLSEYDVAGLFAAGGTGEFFSLTAPEVGRVVRAAVRSTPLGTPILAPAGYGTAQAVELARDAEEAGADGLLLFPPYLTEASQDGLAAHVRAVCAATSLGVVLYSRANAVYRGDPAVAEEVVTTAVTAFGGLDVLVNNAGIMDTMSAAADVSDAEWDRVLRVNLTAPFLLTRAALPHLLAKGKGAIVYTTSEAALRGSAAGAAYTASKQGLVGLVRSVAVMYRDSGVRANAIAPGATMTGITVDADLAALSPQVVGRYRQNVGRLAAADDQAAANVNGAVLPVDGGWDAV